MKAFLVSLLTFVVIIGSVVMGTKALIKSNSQPTSTEVKREHAVKKPGPVRIIRQTKIIERIKIVEAPKEVTKRAETVCNPPPIPKDNRRRPNPVDIANKLRGGYYGMDHRF